VAFRLCLEGLVQGQHYFRYQTGQGKTALCIGIAVAKARQGSCVVVLNESLDLTFRDYKKALALQALAGV